MNFSKRDLAILRKLIEYPGDDFSALSKIAGLNPRVDFRWANLRGVDFGQIDASLYDFAGSDTSGAIFTKTSGKPLLNSIESLHEDAIRPLNRIRDALDKNAIAISARSIAYKILESGGILDRKSVQNDISFLSKGDRRILKSLGIRFGAFSIFMPQLYPKTRQSSVALALGGSSDWHPPLDRISNLPIPPPSAFALSMRGLRAVGPFAIPVEILEQLDGMIRAGNGRIQDEQLEDFGWTKDDAIVVLRALGYKVTLMPNLLVVLRRATKIQQPKVQSPENSPFAALSTLTDRGSSKSVDSAKRKRSRRRRSRGAIEGELTANAAEQNAGSMEAPETEERIEAGLDEKE